MYVNYVIGDVLERELQYLRKIILSSRDQESTAGRVLKLNKLKECVFDWFMCKMVGYRSLPSRYTPLLEKKNGRVYERANN